ncbi:MAG: hypothetical protein WD048_12010 [Chitinophagales bacterium]
MLTIIMLGLVDKTRDILKVLLDIAPLYLALIILEILILFFVKKGRFFSTHFEYNYPFRFWDKSVRHINWTALTNISTLNPYRGGGRQIHMHTEDEKINFYCTEEEVIILEKKLNIKIKRPYFR